MSVALTIGGLVALMIAVATAIAWRRHRRGEGAGQREDVSALSLAATKSTVPEPVAASGDTPEALAAALKSLSTTLWASALSAVRFEFEVPPGHEAVMLAARKALAADPLADRYFPRRPLLMPQLLAAVNDPDAPPLKLAEIIAQDPVLTGNILRLANSVYFRLSSVPVESIQRAVVVCGTDGLQSLAATALVQPVFRAGSEQHSRFPAVLWERCTQASIAAEMCARKWCPADRQAAPLFAAVWARLHPPAEPAS